MPETVVHFQIRMPPHLHEKLATMAKEDKTSLNMLIVKMLERVMDEPKESGTATAGSAGHQRS
jgi:hypothetical protein